MKCNLLRFNDTHFARMVKRLLGEETGAIAMEYIVITLLVATSVIGLVMVFSGNLRNMLGTTNALMTQTNVSGVNSVAMDYHMERENLKYQNDIARQAGNKIGGAFSEPTGGYCEPPPGYDK